MASRTITLLKPLVFFYVMRGSETAVSAQILVRSIYLFIFFKRHITNSTKILAFLTTWLQLFSLKLQNAGKKLIAIL